MKRMTGLVASIATAAILFANAALAGEITVKHAQGETKLPDVPQKVITFDLSSLDTLDTLGVKVLGVPTIKKQDYLTKYDGDDYIRVGTLFEPDYEAVNAAEPDLIIVAGRSAAKYPELAKIAPTIDLTADAKDFINSSEENVRKLAAIFSKDKEAEVALARLNAKKDKLKGLTANAGTGLLVLTTGGKISAYGPGSRFGVLYDEMGVKPAADDIKPGGHGQPISFEYILEKNPDWLYVIDRDAAIGREGVAAEKFLDNAVVGQTDAWKNKQVIYLDGSAWYLNASGLTSMEKIVDQLIDGLKK